MYQLQEAIELAIHIAESFEPQLPELALPPVVEQALEMGADLAVSTSGGKDSDYLLRRLVALHRLKGYTGRIFAIFADLGRIEWIGVHEHLHRLCKELGVELITVRRPQGGMVDRWQQRYESILAKGENKPHWSSSASRFCTAELKRQQVNKNLRKSNLIICAVGIRAQESPNRAKEPVVSVRNKISASYLNPPSMKEYGIKDKAEYSKMEEEWAEKAMALWLASGKKGRMALTWHPILHHSIDDVWAGNGTSQAEVDRRSVLFRTGRIREALEGFPCHWAYVSGNSRLSCGMCVLASKGDISNGAKHNPLTWLELATMEQESGWGFKQNDWLSDLAEQVTQYDAAYYQKLYSILEELTLMKRWASSFSLNLLMRSPDWMLMLWSYEIVKLMAE